MYFEFFLGLRYLKAKRKQAFVSIISIISVVGVMVGVMALIVVLSVMNGFRADLMKKIMSVNTHILIRSYEGNINNYIDTMKAIQKMDGVVETTPSIDSQVLVNGEGGLIRGLDTGSIGKVMNLMPLIKEGTLSSLDELHNGLPGIIIGSEFAGRIGASVGDEITVVSPQGKKTPLGRSPNSKKYIVTGLFNSGYYQYDYAYTFVSLIEAQDLLGMDDSVTSIEVKVRDAEKSDIIGKSISKDLGYPFWSLDWKASNKTLVSALNLEKYTMFIILTMIILVGALNIISALVMVVMEKSRDIAILRAMGATKRSLMRIFMIQGLFVGVAGTLGGLFSGLGLCYFISKYRLVLPQDIYYIDRLPVAVNPLDVTLITLAAVGISFLATIYPSWHASKMDPVEALRYE
jgi:lipoprotein-releasing system permease protein